MQVCFGLVFPLLSLLHEPDLLLPYIFYELLCPLDFAGFVFSTLFKNTLRVEGRH